MDQLLHEQRQLLTPNPKTSTKNCTIDRGISPLQGDPSPSEIDFVAVDSVVPLIKPLEQDIDITTTSSIVVPDSTLHSTSSSEPKTVTQTPASNTRDSKNNTSNLVIIDNIKESWKYKSSSSIKREFCKYFKNEKLVLAYSLKAGGIALHLAKKESADSVLRFVWPAEAFGNSGTQIYCHTCTNKPKVILKNIDTSLSEREIEDIIQKDITEKVSVRRFHYRDTGKRLPVVKVTCSAITADLLLSKTLNILGRDIVSEKFESIHRREITCFNCREKGHIARSCPLLTTDLITE